MFIYFLLSATLTSVLLACATIVRLARSDKAIGSRPSLVRIPLKYLQVATYSVFTLLPVCFFMAWNGTGNGPWDLASVGGFTLAFYMVWGISTRCESPRVL